MDVYYYCLWRRTIALTLRIAVKFFLTFSTASDLVLDQQVEVFQVDVGYYGLWHRTATPTCRTTLIANLASCVLREYT